MKNSQVDEYIILLYVYVSVQLGRKTKISVILWLLGGTCCFFCLDQMVATHQLELFLHHGPVFSHVFHNIRLMCGINGQVVDSRRGPGVMQWVMHKWAGCTLCCIQTLYSAR